MNRTAVVSLVAAAVVGIAGGAVSAVTVGDDHPPTASSPHGPRHTPAPSLSTRSPSVTPQTVVKETNEPLLYAANGKIHDGRHVVAFPKGEIRRLARAGGGWLVATAASVEDSPTFDLWFLTDSRPARRIAEVSTWDPDADGARVTAYDVDAGQVRVWSLPTLTADGAYTTEGSPGLTPAFAGHDVLISQDIGSQIDLVRWNPDTGDSNIIGNGWDDLSVSPGGSYAAGAVGPKGTSGKTNLCLHLESTYLKKQHVTWNTCAWRTATPARFSPDGTRLLAIPGKDRGDHPAELGVIDASDGPGTPVATVKVPPLTQGAEWADNDHLYVYGSNREDTATGGMWIKRCDLAGTCTKVVATTSAKLTVGSGL